jgi:hypothetical protein
VTGRRWALVGLLLVALIGTTGADAEGKRAAAELGNLDRRTSETSYRSAVADGAAEVLDARGFRLSRPLRCHNLWSGDRLDTSCEGTTANGRPVLVLGSSAGIDQPNPQQDYRLSVGGEQVWQGTCLGDGCRVSGGARRQPGISSTRA